MNLLRNKLSISTAPASMFARDPSGASAVAFALSAPIALLCIAGVMSYMSALQYQTDVQSAADAAALATATTLNSNPNANAKQVATNYFEANAPSSVNSTGLSVYTGDSAGASTISAQVGYHGTAPALLAGSGTLGMFSNSNGVSSLTINAMGSAHVTAGSSTGGSSSSSSSSSSSGGTSTSSSTNTACANNPNGCYLEMGSLDMVGLAGTLFYPSPLGAGASLTSVANNNSCVPGNWYNLISDAGFELNATCSASPYFSGAPYFSGITIVENLNGVKHTASFTVAPATYPAKPSVYPAAANFTFNAATAWLGGVTVDGVYSAPPAGCNKSTGGWSSKTSLGVIKCWPAWLDGTVSVTEANDVTFTQGYIGTNTIEVMYPGYFLLLSIDTYGGFSGWITMSGGAEGAPGGIIGQATAGLSDPNFADFQVSGPSATSYQFDWKYNAALGAAEISDIVVPQSAALTAATLPYIVQ